MKPQKIYELKGEDFTKGLSHKSSFPIGGIFSSAENFDPFEDYGYLKTSLDAVVTDSSITSTPTVLTSWNSSGTAYIYSHTPTKLYRVLDASPYTTTDVTAQITITGVVTGAIIYQNKYLYQDSTAAKVYANSLPVAIGNEVEILSGFSSTEHYHPMASAPDKNLYVGDFANIHRITSVTGTAGNTANYYALEGGMAVRDMVSDGKYLVVITDNNASNKIASVGARGNYRCQVLFYDVNNGRSTADFIYEFTDSYLISVKYLDGVVYIIGRENIWTCNSVTQPKAIFSFDSNSTITEPPINPYQVTQNKNSLFWCGQTNQKIYAFGSLISGMKKVFYQPYSAGSTPSAITTNGTQFYVGTSGANQSLKILNTGSTRTITTSTTSSLYLQQPYSFAFARIVMKSKLSSGGEVYFGITNNNGENISKNRTKTFSEIGAKQSIIFNLENDSAPNVSLKSFNDFKLTIGSNQSIAKVELWAYPIDNYDQTI